MDSELKSTVLSFLNGHHKMVLASIEADGSPNTSLLLYAADDDLNIYFGTRKAFGKYAALKKDGRVALSVIQEDVDPLKSVDMDGVAEEIGEGDVKGTLEWFTQKNTAKYYVKDAPDFTMFKITPSSIRWLDASSGELQMHDLLKK